MRRAGTLLLLLLTLVAAGCGGDHKRALTPLDDALGYFAKDAPFVAAIETDPNGPQIQQLRSLVGRFPGSELAGGRIESLLQLPGVDWQRDVKPQLGAPLVVGLMRPAAGRTGIEQAAIVALRVKHPLHVKQLILRQPGVRGTGKSSGVRIFENSFQKRVIAVDGDVVVAATERATLEEALAMRRSDNRMREADLNRALAKLPPGGLVRVSADPRMLIGADARLRPALHVKWIASLRRLGLVAKASPTGITADFRLTSDGGSLSDNDLPLAPAAGPLPLIGGRDEIQFGLRGPDHFARFAVAVLRAIAPRQLDRLRAREPRGVDLERQLPHHLTKVTLGAFDPVTRELALRASLVEPRDVRDALAPLARALPGLAAAFGIKGLGVATPAPGENFYAVAKPNGRTLVFGVLGSSLVAASDAARAAGLLSEPTHVVRGAAGSAALTLNARELAGRLLARRLNGPAALLAPLAVASLRDLTGGVSVSRGATTGHFKLTIVK